MNVPAGVSDLTSALVQHSTAALPIVRRQHVDFVARRLGLGFAALACAPLFLGLRGAPSGLEMLIFACSLAPLGAATIVLGTGRAVAGHAFAALGLVGFGLSLWLGIGCGAGTAIAWLLVAHFEARLAGDRRLSGIADVATMAALAGIVIAASLVDPARSVSATASAISAGLALVYAWIIYPTRWHADTSVVVQDGVTNQEDEAATWYAIAHAIEDVVIGLDATGCVTRVRLDGAKDLGVSAGDLMDFGLFERLQIGDRSLLLKALADAARSDETIKVSLMLRSADAMRAHPNFRRIELRLRRAETNEAAGANAAPRLIGILREVGADHAETTRPAAQIQPIDDASRPEDRFLANMSHELRTPLNAIIGFSEMLASHTLRPADTAKQLEYARIINQSGQHLLSVVNSILDMSKIQAGTFAIAAEPFDLCPLIDLCCDMVMLNAHDGRIELVRDYAARPASLIGDKRACKQILINLLSNAVKFTPEHGQVTVAVKQDGADVLVSVSDTGIGIGAADLARLGAPFFQAGSSLDRQFEGTGLGLSVVRGLVGLHGGSITIESEPGHGTSVRVRLPLDGRLADRAASTTIETLNKRRPAEPVPHLSDTRMKQVA